MTDLFEMLGIGAEDAGAADPLGPAAGAAAAERFTNPNAFAVDRWGVRRGVQLLAADPDLGVDGHAAADMMAAAFEVRPELLPGCSDPLKHRFLAELLDTPAYREAHRHTALDDAAAGLAAMEYARAFAALVKDNPSGVDGTPQGDRAVARAAAAGAAAGGEEVRGYVDAAYGCGLDPARLESGLDRDRAAKVFRKVRNSPRLRNIMELAGAFRRLAQGKQRLRETHSVGEVCDLTLGGEVERLVPAELARFVLPGTAYDSYRRLLQRQCLVREHRAPTPEGRGPVVVLVDESGSMGESAGGYNRIEQAKGLALALAWVAREQRRWCCLYSFGMGPHTRGVVIPPGGGDDEALIAWLDGFMHAGGTDLDVLTYAVPGLKHPDYPAAPSLWDQWVAQGMARGKTDVILLTDGQMPEPANLDEFRAWKARERVRVLAVEIGQARGSYGGVPAVSDEAHACRSLAADTEAAGAAVNIA